MPGSINLNKVIVADINPTVAVEIASKQNHITLVGGANITVVESPADTWTISTTGGGTVSVSGNYQPYHENLDDISNIDSYGLMVRTGYHGGSSGYNLLKPIIDSSLDMAIPNAPGYNGTLTWKVNDYISKTEVTSISGGLNTRLTALEGNYDSSLTLDKLEGVVVSSPQTNQALIYDTDGVWKNINVSVSVLEKKFTLSAGHGLEVGNIVRDSGTSLVKALANNIANSNWIGIVSKVNGNDVTIATSGIVSELSGLTRGTIYYLSSTTEGAYIDVEPTSSGLVSAPVFTAISTTEAVLSNARPLEISSTPSITGSREGNVALASLLTALAAKGLIIDSTTA